VSLHNETAARIFRAATSNSSLEMEAAMRPTTAPADNILDINFLLHPGTSFDHPRDVVTHPKL
jgi:hypothetical protein